MNFTFSEHGFFNFAARILQRMNRPNFALPNTSRGAGAFGWI